MNINDARLTDDEIRSVAPLRPYLDDIDLDALVRADWVDEVAVPSYARPYGHSKK